MITADQQRRITITVRGLLFPLVVNERDALSV